MQWDTPIGLIEYNEDKHLYYVNGIWCPSITSLVGLKFKNDYSSVPKAILERAAKLGTRMHDSIEAYETLGFDDEEDLELQEYKILKEESDFIFLEDEIPVVLFDENNMPIACGRLDLLFKNKENALIIVDLKRHAQLNKSKVEFQCNLYATAYKQTYGKDVNLIACFHIRDKVFRRVNLELMPNYTYIEALKLLKEKKEEKENE